MAEKRDAAFTAPLWGFSEEEDFFCDDFDREALHIVAVGPFGIVEAALDFDEIAFCLMLRDGFAQAIEDGDAVKLGNGIGVAFFVFDRFAINDFGAIGYELEIGDGCIACVAGFGGACEAADQDNEIFHDIFLFCYTADCPPMNKTGGG